jgi:hypothetical protein
MIEAHRRASELIMDSLRPKSAQPLRSAEFHFCETCDEATDEYFLLDTDAGDARYPGQLLVCPRCYPE